MGVGLRLLPAYRPLDELKPAVFAQARNMRAVCRYDFEPVRSYSSVARSVPEASASPALYGWLVFHQIPPACRSQPRALMYASARSASLSQRRAPVAR